VTALDDALLEELRLRSRLNALVHERQEAQKEAERIDVRGGLPGADDGLRESAQRWRTVADGVARDIEEQRSALRRQEAEVERLRQPGPERPPA
jgi:hypothetical protein